MTIGVRSDHLRVGGRQYVAVSAENNLFVYALRR
jgi:hypothetical protein